MLFKLVPGGFSELINYNNQNANWKKLLGFRNMQENLQKVNSRVLIVLPWGSEIKKLPSVNISLHCTLIRITCKHVITKWPLQDTILCGYMAPQVLLPCWHGPPLHILGFYVLCIFLLARKIPKIFARMKTLTENCYCAK